MDSPVAFVERKKEGEQIEIQVDYVLRSQSRVGEGEQRRKTQNTNVLSVKKGKSSE